MTTLRDGARAPSSPFPVLPLRNGVLFPGAVIALPIGRERSVALVRTLNKGDVIGVLTQKDRNLGDPAESDLYRLGTFARVVETGRLPSGDMKLVIEGVGRMHLGRIVRRDPFWLAEGEVAAETSESSEEAKLFARALFDQVRELGRGIENSIEPSLAEEDPGLFADRVSALLGLTSDKDMRVLEALDVVERLRIVAGFVIEQKSLSEVKRKIEQDVRREIGNHQREAILREQLRAIKKELGEESSDDETGKLRERLEKANLPEEVRTVADREIKRLEALSPQQAEYNVIRTYLDWIAELPWSQRADAKDDIDAVGKKLDEDHYGLGDVKRRILEHIAVLKLKGTAKGSILCLAGPPGVGKTSIGQSIADATGRPFVRIALGGVRDEAEIRGHRRTYVAALPGRIVHGMKKAKVKNPVVLLDEIDKLAVGWAGNPEAALLEVLDPEQNKTFQDHYLELPFDLSEVLFVCTANDLGTLSAPLRDRLEIIEVPGYTPDEKAQIARRHLIPKQLAAHGIPEGTLTITDDALRAIVRDYTREAGVRQLEREIKKLCRALSLEVARAKDEKPNLHVEESDLGKYLGKVKFFAEVAERTASAGVATGMAWTPVGGDILFIETSRMPGRGRVEITGQLGDVMKESAKAALSYVKSHAAELGVDTSKLEEEDLHIHVPAGAVPKDGPSAGVTMFTALTSLLSSRRVRSDTAMTGECTLRGRVLPVGGIKAKVMAAHRAGIKRVILPQKNARDVEEVPEEVRSSLTFVFAEDMSQVIHAALEDRPADEETVPLGNDAETGGEVRAVH
ncbi:endopeptidase La [Polyangium jinanense]|uniref:Lon protease n=1 Tax=Polyangium jinanense TaxID=2829994 RepID=A0A9X3X5Q4_9BACT|nr:endopeptidase La [Polyangium jinanense]MDC3956684.1 endopeptidase La [Polyangium jinanense]MDC3984747.1 endopeptidase La [Polyangium jinanense]